jgi:hypothetical protein
MEQQMEGNGRDAYLAYISSKMFLKKPSYCFRIVFLVEKKSGNLRFSAYSKHVFAKSRMDCSE